MKKYKVLEFNQLGDKRGHLVVVEGMRDIPFEMKRMFYIYGTDKNIVRGQHANKISRFVLINLVGECKIKVNDGKNEEIVILDKPHKGVYLDKMVWKDMYDFSKDSVLLVISDNYYDSKEYIREFKDFKQYIKGENHDS